MRKSIHRAIEIALKEKGHKKVFVFMDKHTERHLFIQNDGIPKGMSVQEEYPQATVIVTEDVGEKLLILTEI